MAIDTLRAQQKLNAIGIHVEPNPAFIKRKKRAFTQKIEQFFYKHRNKLIFIHSFMFIFFLALMVIPLFLPPPVYGATIWNNFTEFSQFMIWGLWFPLVFISVLFTGRSWCGVLCPMGAASEWMNGIGLKRSIPGWLRWEGTPVLSFIVITILGQTVDVRDEASAMAEIFGGTLILALLIGFLYGKGKKKRAWCRHVCPIGLLLGVFSRMGIVQFATKLSRKNKHAQDRYTEQGICPTMIDVSHKQESRHCIECFRCVKPSSQGGLFVRLRKPGEEIEQIKQHNPNAAEVWFILLSTGISLGGFLWLILPQYQLWRNALATWFINHDWYWVGNVGPRWLMSVHPLQHQTYRWIDFIMIVGFMVGCMVLLAVIVGALNWLSSFIAEKYQPNTLTLSQRFIELGYQYTPIAMMAIIISLGDKLFQTLISNGVSAATLGYIKGVLLLGSLLWSFKLGYRILHHQGLVGKQLWYALLPGMLASLLLMLVWWPAVFGIDYSILENYRTHLLIVN
ncbi:MAG: 4Fe-4S binding protein [Gammaproteobacteria bacterium]